MTERICYRLDEASGMVGVGKDVLREAIRVGDLAAKRSGKNGGGIYLISRGALEAWFEGLPDA